MFQIRIHGRGGQGVVTAAEMLSIAAFGEGRHAQAFPSFGSERTGAPVELMAAAAHLALHNLGGCFISQEHDLSSVDATPPIARSN